MLAITRDESINDGLYKIVLAKIIIQHPASKTVTYWDGDLN